MSSPLKQNTTTLQELLNTINSLPEIETITVDINSMYWDGFIWYTDNNYIFHVDAIQAGATIDINCLKNSPVIFSGRGFNPSIESSYEINYGNDMNGEGMYIYHFTEDSSIIIRNLEVLPE